ncbi:MAG: YihY/virulence factor BrkB family protein [Burkholderiales bacterium]
MIGRFWTAFKLGVNGWLDDRAASMGAALAYYTAFSLAPLLIIAIAIAGFFFGRDAAQEAMVGQLGGLLGETGGAAISDILERTSDFGSGVLGLIVGVGALLLGATTAFVELQDDLDRIWNAPPRVGSGIVNLIRSRLLSFGMVLFIGFLLTVSLAVSAVVATLGTAMFASMEAVLQVLTFAVSFAVITALFAMIYKVLPNAKTDWREVWVGAAITALLFEAGKFLIGLYIGKSEVATGFGAAGPFVVLMLWIYYSTQIFLLGAEFTVAYSGRRKPEAAAGAPITANVQAAAGGARTVAGSSAPAFDYSSRGAGREPAAMEAHPMSAPSGGRLLFTALAMGFVLGAAAFSKKSFPDIE